MLEGEGETFVYFLGIIEFLEFLPNSQVNLKCWIRGCWASRKGSVHCPSSSFGDPKGPGIRSYGCMDFTEGLLSWSPARIPSQRISRTMATNVVQDRLGDLFVREGLITQDQLEEALRGSSADRGPASGSPW